MAQHFFKVGMTYVPKNKLHEDIQAFVKSLDNTLMTSDMAKNDFVNMLKAKLANLNKKNARCKPVEMHFFKWSKTGIRVDGNLTADIFPVKIEFNNTDGNGK